VSTENSPKKFFRMNHYIIFVYGPAWLLGKWNLRIAAKNPIISHKKFFSALFRDPCLFSSSWFEFLIV
jgi:hypothetical protein